MSKVNKQLYISIWWGAKALHYLTNSYSFFSELMALLYIEITRASGFVEVFYEAKILDSQGAPSQRLLHILIFLLLQ